jgi:hypothetical protein
MTLGDVFGWLGRIPVRLILKIWGYAAAGILVSVIVLCLIALLYAFLVFTVQVIGWPIFLFILFIVGGLVANMWISDKDDDFLWKNEV